MFTVLHGLNNHPFSQHKLTRGSGKPLLTSLYVTKTTSAPTHMALIKHGELPFVTRTDVFNL